ncbi:YjfA family protein [Micromonospora sp. CPCC 205371]|nr:YjfA family protein [Micromonospora sp. CPCC 205371]
MRQRQLLVAFVVMSLTILGLSTPAGAARSGAEQAPRSDDVMSLEEYHRLRAEPLAANPGCGSKCDFKNPETFYVYWCGLGCEDNWRCSDDARTIDETNGVELRYSPSCRTTWARASGCYDWSVPVPCTFRIISYYYSGGSWRERTRSEGYADLNNYYSLMLNDAGYCAEAAITRGPGTSYTICY